MHRNLLFSVPRWAVFEAKITPATREGLFLDALEAAGVGIELYEPAPYAFDLQSTKRYLDSRGIDIETVHGAHLQCLSDNRGGVTEMVTDVRHLHLASVISRTPDVEIAPRVSTHHPPRFWTVLDADLDEERAAFLDVFADALTRLEPDEFDGTCITATIALENVAPRGPFDYLLTTPEDVDSLRTTAAELGVSDALAFTCDVGHAADSVEMIHAMRDIENVHLHSHIPANDARISTVRDHYGLSAGDTVGDRDRPGQFDHLPPAVGDVDVPNVLDALDDVGYDGPITVELHPTYWTADVVTETRDEIRAYA